VVVEGLLLVESLLMEEVGRPAGTGAVVVVLGAVVGMGASVTGDAVGPSLLGGASVTGGAVGSSLLGGASATGAWVEAGAAVGPSSVVPPGVGVGSPLPPPGGAEKGAKEKSKPPAHSTADAVVVEAQMVFNRMPSKPVGPSAAPAMEMRAASPPQPHSVSNRQLAQASALKAAL